MARKHLPVSSNRGESSLLESSGEGLRGMVERMERFFEKPWDFFGATIEPKLDIEQTPKELIVSARLPGYTRDDVTVDLTEDSITLRGCKSSSKESRKHGSYREEQTFVRSMTLPASVKTGEAKASFKGDMLEIRLPRDKEADVRRLQIE